MRKLTAILFAGLLAATPVLTTAAQAQTITQTQGPQDGFGFNGPGFYLVGGIALIGLTLGIIALLDENHHHQHHQFPVSP
jgi:Spy/CpxP family protein refolding chaperone